MVPGWTHLRCPELLDVCQALNAHLELLIALMELHCTKGIQDGAQESCAQADQTKEMPKADHAALTCATSAGLMGTACSAVAAASRLSMLQLMRLICIPDPGAQQSAALSDDFLPRSVACSSNRLLLKTRYVHAHE